jgi:hypothetical protein
MLPVCIIAINVSNARAAAAWSTLMGKPSQLSHFAATQHALPSQKQELE